MTLDKLEISIQDFRDALEYFHDELIINDKEFEMLSGGIEIVETMLLVTQQKVEERTVE